jgi:hypothetical protein
LLLPLLLLPLPLLLPLLLAHLSGFRFGMVSVGERSASSPHSSSMLVVCRPHNREQKQRSGKHSSCKHT